MEWVREPGCSGYKKDEEDITIRQSTYVIRSQAEAWEIEPPSRTSFFLF